MTGLKETEIGSIPQEWQLVKLEEIADKLKAGGTPQTTVKSYWDGDIPLVKVEDVVNANKYLERTNLYITQEGLDKSSAYLLPANSIVFTMYGTAGEVAINKVPVAPTQNVLGIVKSQRVDNDFLYYALKFSKTRALELIVDRTIFKHFTLAKAKNLLISLPSFLEQFNIVKILSVVQSAIETQEKIIKTTTELKKALMQKLFTEGLHGEKQKETEIGRVPKSWEVVKLAEVVSYIDYGISQAIPKTPIRDGVKIVSTADISKDGKLLYEKIRRIVAPARTIERLTLKEGDLLFNWRNTAELIGKSAVFQEQTELHIFASFILRIRCDEKKSHNHFLCYLMNYYREQGVFVKLSRRAVNQANYNRNEISVLPIQLPSYQEQVEIAEALRVVENKIASSKGIKAKFETLFTTMLHHLMTGQIRVKDLRF